MDNNKKKKVCLTVLSIAASIHMLEEEKKRSKRKIWTRKWLLRRKELGCYDNLMKELALEDAEGYRRWIRMSTSDFEFLLEKVSPFITKQDTKMRNSISPAEKLAVTLRFLATGETQSSLAFQFRIAQNTISGFLPEVCDALCRELKDFVETPKTKEDWLSVSTSFENMWNFPMCVGAVDGKHITISPPPGSGSSYYNYKGDFSIVLMAVVDANYQFIYVDIGTNGRISDGGVWGKCTLKKALDCGILNLPGYGVLPNCDVRVPYVLVGDDAFPLSTYLMKPYPGRNLTGENRIFNYRLSRARRVSENAFGILSSRFRIFKTTIVAHPTKVKKYVATACALHNFLKVRSSTYFSPNLIDKEDIGNGTIERGDFRGESTNMVNLRRGGANSTNEAKEMRNRFRTFFNSVGAVPWQDKMSMLP